ncbi:hypothetical protein Mal4_10480 [Maioricimonas rarisocia]|uniref:Uncharacterized protein n=1 Tax=Maioricimonas rarisocia TaxID=2528026 RepID=A0A517Z2P2_9PLAN|nr:hypothetical protein [Maioricimonas rarisocia]QDU36750.1 hypothetical protein Mal4_10480 [Maioricimonas rarisocia]
MSSDADRQDVDSSSEMVEPRPVEARRSGPLAVRTILYGGLVVAGGALMAVSAKPELASYVPFVPEKEKAAPTCALSKGPSCCAHAAEETAVAAASEGSCCASVSRFAAATCVSESDLATDDEFASITPPAPPLPERL